MILAKLAEAGTMRAQLGEEDVMDLNVVQVLEGGSMELGLNLPFPTIWSDEEQAKWPIVDRASEISQAQDAGVDRRALLHLKGTDNPVQTLAKPDHIDKCDGLGDVAGEAEIGERGDRQERQAFALVGLAAIIRGDVDSISQGAPDRREQILDLSVMLPSTVSSGEPLKSLPKVPSRIVRTTSPTPRRMDRNALSRVGLSMNQVL
ncbi:MAG: hypothetical protein HY331_02510 [Chloroflexi bacterium]|nr:hypothetical protein [Chloroflexota bacterium]